MRKGQVTLTILLSSVLVTSGSVSAQVKPPTIVEAITGWAGFVDENWTDRTIVGASGRIFVTSQVAVGPEFLYLHGVDHEHDWTLTCTVTMDLISEGRTTSRPRR